MKKKSLLLIVLLLVITLTIGASYALWQATHKQESKNVVSIGCFNLESDIGTEGEQAPISLMDAMPISDDDGMNLSPFTFTITNTCNMYAAYQVNLETLSATTLGPDYLKVALSSNTPAVLSSYLSVSPTISGATSSNKLISGGLRQGESITYDLRLWLDESTPRIEGSNKIYNGKISIVAVPGIEENAITTIKALVKGKPTNSLDVITVASPNGATCTNTLAYDNTEDNNLRYVGSDPCNYVYFNCSTTEPSEMNSTTCEVWRIIGVMNNIDDGTNTSETRMKIVRVNPILSTEGHEYFVWSYDEQVSRLSNQWGSYEGNLANHNSINDKKTVFLPSIINDNKVNVQKDALLFVAGALTNIALNTSYIDSSTPTNLEWYLGDDGSFAYYDTSQTLNQNALSMFKETKWYTGAANDTLVDSFEGLSASQIYINERSNNPHSVNNGVYCSSGYLCNATLARTFTSVDMVGLIYPSDYLYSTSGANQFSRNTCLGNAGMTYWKYGEETDICSNGSWLSNNGNVDDMFINCWTITPFASSTNGAEVISIGNGGSLLNEEVRTGREIHPTLHLKSNVKITGGDGSSTNPYTLGI